MALGVNKVVLQKGLHKGLSTTWELAKVVVPTTMVVAILRSSGLLGVFADFFAPYMKFLGLPGDAALVLFSGYLVNLYAATASILALELTAVEITILAVMLGFAHSLVIELVVSKKAGSPISYVLPLRLGASILSGLILGGIL